MKDPAGQLEAIPLPEAGPPPEAFLRVVRARGRGRRAVQVAGALALCSGIGLAAFLASGPGRGTPAPELAGHPAVPVPDAPPAPSQTPAPRRYALMDPPPINAAPEPATLGLGYRIEDRERWLRQ